eukprot:CAMPEP_0115849444 /NCGR_PEP_ID=MMETSP0287-20121206/11453_1 /TAXON_ID=412157 /ORGANISM="Chrysochromulina rotalis, Strain UIO044" /LENGTH=356 /DNA_ID=CAMNT_0003303413 /DNA_START=60 /DNA_END=1130 /DNA_ORIENTATION=+
MSRRALPPRGRGGLAPPEETNIDPKLTAVADWLRNEKRSGLNTKEAVQYEKRVEYFKGSKLIDALMGPKYKGKVANDMPIKTRAEAAKLAQELLKVGYIHRSQRIQHAHTRRWELEMYRGPFEEDGLFTWVYEGSKTKLYLMCAGMLIGALGLCMIQIWPLWLKIGVWWCSVTFLTTFGVLCVVRLILFVLFWIVGFRGIWLFPNLFDDNQTFAGSFQPIFGKGDPVVVEEDSDEEYWEHMRKKKKKDGKEDSTDEKDKKPKSDSKDKPAEPNFQFGWVNVVVIFGLGAIVCIKMGLFDGDNVPDFIAKRDDLEYYFKSLAAPEPPPNDTATGGDGDGKPTRDPFAAPSDDEGGRF